MADNRLREMVNTAESNIAKLFNDDAAMKNFLEFIQKNTHLTYYAASMIQGTNYADTYDGWKERGFQVNAGEHGIPVFQKRKTIKRKFIDESGKIRDLATASYIEKQKIQNGDLKITSDLSSYYVINHLFSQEQTTAKDKNLDIAVPVSNLSFENIKSIVEESTNDILDGDDFVVPNSIMQCTVAYATYMLCLSDNISGDKDELFEQSISSLSDSKERLTLSEQKLVLNSAIKVIRSEHTKELIESLKTILNENEELSARYSESIEYGGFEYQVIDKWQNDVGTYIVGRLEADDGPWYAAKVIDKTEQFSGEYEYEFSNERPSQIEVEDMHLNHISEIDIDRHEAEYGADGSRAFPNLNEPAPAEEQEELKQIVAADITNIECTGRNYDKGNRENTYTFKCEIQGKINNLTYIVSSHDDGESFSIHSEKDDIWTSMDESELNKLENVLRNESFFYLWQQKIINAASESELDTISLDFLEVENVPTSIARRIYDCIGEKSKELGNSISAVSIDGHDCSIIDTWQNGTCSYTLGQDLNDNTFYYAKVEDSNENWKGTYTYEFDFKPVREEVEIVHLNKISALDIDNHEKVYGADGEIAVPGLNNEPEPKKKNKIEDFGKKIGGARKDLWKLRGLMVDDLLEMNLAEKNKYATKNNIFPKPDYQKMVDDGLPVRTAYFIKTVRDGVAMKKIRRLLLKKEQGSVGYFFIVMILFIVLAFIAVYEISFQKTVHLKNKVDNGIILSTLSANVVDLYQYASSGDIAYATSYQTAANLYVGPDGLNYTGYSDPINANKDAGKIALERFVQSLDDNLSFINFSHSLSVSDHYVLPVSSDDKLVKSARIDEFILYNKVGDKIYKSEKNSSGDFNVTELAGTSDPAVEKANNIENSCIYVKMTFEFYVMGDMTVSVPFDELVSITTT